MGRDGDLEKTTNTEPEDLERLRSREDLAVYLEAHRIQADLTYDEIVAKLGSDPATEVARSSVNDWLRAARLPNRASESRFLACLATIGVPDQGAVLNAISRIRASERERVKRVPFVGLRPYGPEDADLFFGRENEISSNLKRIRELADNDPGSPITVIGASGSGKSSLLRAGLLGRLDKKPDSCRLVELSLNPATEIESTVEEVIAERKRSRRTTGRDYVVLDQFERLLLHPEGQVQADTIGLLEANSDSSLIFILALRSDFYPLAAQFGYLSAGLGQRSCHVSPLTAEKATQAATRAAKSTGWLIEPELLDRVGSDFQAIADGRGAANALPLLSHVLHETATVATGSRLTLQDYESIGSLGGALEEVAERTYRELARPAQSNCANVLMQLVQLAADGRATSRRTEIRAVEQLFGGLAVVVIESFVEARLVTVNGDGAQLSHETLTRAWPRMTGWIEDVREELRAEQRIKARSQLWLDGGGQPDGLLSGTELAPATALIQRPDSSARLTSEQQDFVKESERAEEARQRQRARTVQLFAVMAGAFACAAIIAGLFSLRASSARDDAGVAQLRAEAAQRDAEAAQGNAEAAQQEALSRQLALQSSVLQDSDRSLSSQLALVSFATSPTVEALSALLDAAALPQNPRSLGSPGSTAVATSPDGEFIAYSDSVEGQIRLMSRESGSFESRATMDLPDREQTVYAMSFSSDSQVLASTGSDGGVTLWDLEGGEIALVEAEDQGFFEGRLEAVLFAEGGSRIYAGGEGPGVAVWTRGEDGLYRQSEMLPVDRKVMSLSIDDSGQVLAVAVQDGRVELWDTADATEPFWVAAAVDETVTSTVALSPDGTQLVAGYRNSTLRRWNVGLDKEPTEVSDAFERFASWVTWVQFGPDGLRFAAASSDGTARVWNTTNWQREGPELRHPTVATSIRFLTPDEVVVAVADGSVRRWDLRHSSFSTLDASIWSTGFDRSGTLFLAASGKAAATWRFSMSGLEDERAILLPFESSGLTGAAAISPDGKHAALGTRAGPVYVVPVGDADSAPTVLDGLTNLVENVAFSQDGNALVGGDDDGNIQMWVRSDAGVLLATGQTSVADLAMNVSFGKPENLVIALSDEGFAHLLDFADPGDPREVSRVETGASIAFGLASHPTLPVFATGNADGTVAIWRYDDPSAPERISVLTGPNSRVFSVAFDPAGERLAAGVGDGTLWLWDVADEPTLLAVLNAAEQGVLSVAFSQDGQQLIGAGQDTSMLIWEMDDLRAMGAVCAGIGDHITETEWSDYVPAVPYSPPCPD